VSVATVDVRPAAFSYVDFDAGRIAALASELLDRIALPGPLRVDVDETVPLARASVTSVRPLVVAAESGAFEDPRRPRRLSDRAVVEVLGRLLLRVGDRRAPGFGAAPADEALSLAHFQFRTRHGFSDTVDAVFRRLWEADGLTWEELAAASEEAAAAAVPVPG